MRHLHPTFPCTARSFFIFSLIFSFSMVSLVRVSKYARRCIFVRKIGQVLPYHMLSPFSFPPLRTYATISLLPSHQEPRRRMYFYDGDAPWISSANENVQRDISILGNKTARFLIFALLCRKYFIRRSLNRSDASARCSILQISCQSENFVEFNIDYFIRKMKFCK